MKLSLIVVLGMSLVACRESSSSPAPPTSQAPVDTGVQIARVSWPGADRIDRAALAKLPAPASANVARATVPVLVPASPSLLAKGIVMTEPVFYAFSSSQDGMNVSVQGTRGEYPSGDVVPFERSDTVHGKPAIVTDTDAIWTVTWIESGVAYALTVECARADDARCKDKSYILELADSLAYVGGAGEAAR